MSRGTTLVSVAAPALVAGAIACQGTSSAGVANPAAVSAGTPAELLRVTYQSPRLGEPRSYLLYLPVGYSDAEPRQSPRQWPVLLFLHGNGERGDGQADLDYLLKNGPLFEAWIQKRDLPFLIIAPQLPLFGQEKKADYLRNRTRAEIPARLEAGVSPRPPEFPTSGKMTARPEREPLPHGPEGPPVGWPELEADVLLVLDQVLQTRRADPHRVYLTGVSYGGFGTWYLGSRHAERFAALAPVVGWGHPELMDPIAKRKLPVWCFAGGRDSAVPLEYFYAGMNRLEELGHADVRFTIEADMGHDVWARVYAGEDVYQWLLQFRTP